MRGIATDRNYKNIVYGFYKDLYHPFKLIEKLEELYRGRIFLKYADKFELKFHHHFDGEIYVGKWSRRDNTPTFWLEGAHNHDVIGKKIQIGAIRVPPGIKSFHMLPDNVPFKANVELKYNNNVIPKQNTSFFFQKIGI